MQRKKSAFQTKFKSLESDSIAWNESGTALYLNHKIIPEPTTATLSLLTLADLALRRRRK